MRDNPTIDLDTNFDNGTALLFAVLHFTVTVASSRMSITHTLK